MTGRRWPRHGRARARRQAAQQRAAVHGMAWAVGQTTKAMQQLGATMREANAAVRDMVRTTATEEA